MLSTSAIAAAMMYADANEAQGGDVEIRPIYSAEDTMWSAGAEASVTRRGDFAPTSRRSLFVA